MVLVCYEERTFKKKKKMIRAVCLPNLQYFVFSEDRGIYIYISVQ